MKPIAVAQAAARGLYAAWFKPILAAILREADEKGPQPATSPIETGQPAFPFADEGETIAKADIEAFRLDI